MAQEQPQELVTHRVRVNMSFDGNKWTIHKPDTIWIKLGELDKLHDVMWEFETGQNLTTDQHLEIVRAESPDGSPPENAPLMQGDPFPTPKGSGGHKIVRSGPINATQFQKSGTVKSWCYKIKLFRGGTEDAVCDPWIVISKP